MQGMQGVLTMEGALRIWWVLINGLLYYAVADFLLRYLASPKRAFIPLYVASNTLLTVVAVCAQIYFPFTLVQVVLLFLFVGAFLKMPFKRVVTPAIIIFTFFTFMEGFATVFMRYLSSTIKNQSLGVFYQFAIPALLAGLFFFALRMAAKKYPPVKLNIFDSYLYILLLPSAVIIAGIRISLGLDSNGGILSHGALITGEFIPATFAMFWMAGALLVFFLILAVFHKLRRLSQQATEHALLASALKAQHSYMEEARQRSEEYRAFQHDIKNHLLVVSGLLCAEKYQQAHNYLQKLRAVAVRLAEGFATGNAVLDILLWEKKRYAEQHQIDFQCDVQLAKECGADDVDLCILFANGIDNAIQACIQADLAYKTIEVSAKPKHNFLLVNIANGINCPKPLLYGTGLKNMEMTAKKYAGTINIEQTEHQFLLSILLCCPKRQK